MNFPRVRLTGSIINFIYFVYFVWLLVLALSLYTENKFVLILQIITAYASVLIGGFHVGDLIRVHVYRNHKWGWEHIVIACNIIICLHIGSWIAGRSYAKLEMELSHPVVFVGDEKEIWYLLSTAGDNYILASLPKDRRFANFRLVPITPDVLIRGQHKNRLFPAQSTPSAPGSD